MRFLGLIFIFSTLLFANMCDEIRRDINSFFLNDSNFEKIDKNLKCVDIMYSLKNLKDVSMQIRGVNIDCDGAYAITYQKQFQYKVLKALMAPEIYKKTLLSSEESDKINNENRTYFKEWSIKSLYNFNKLAEFNSLYQVAVPMLVDYYKQEFGYDEGSAIFFANRLSSEYLSVAVGNHKNKSDVGNLDKYIMASDFDINGLLDYLYTNHPYSLELDNALKTAILEKKDLNFIETLIRWGANLNSGYENSLFFALNDINMVDFLISKGADVNYKNTIGETPLFSAVSLKNEDVINLLIRRGANVNARVISSYEKMGIVSTMGDYTPFGLCGLNHTSKTLLMHAAKYSNLKIVKKLITFGAKIDEVDDLGFNVVDFATMNSDKKISRYLYSLGLKENILYGEYLNE